MNKANCLQVAEDVLADLGPCDILVNGAGGNNARANTDKEYFEMGDLDTDTVTFFDLDEKIHVTPDEQKSWGLSQGNRVQTFDTDCGKIGILICYDVEFPELSRIMAEDGMQILFVPFNTDTQNAYARVKVCAQARAVENECYVAIAGSVGNLPRVHNMDIQYAQSAVFTPCDFAFPTDGKRAMATPGTEQILVADCDLTLLNELHTYGSVRNLRDRRNDLYELRMKKDR